MPNLKTEDTFHRLSVNNLPQDVVTAPIRNSIGPSTVPVLIVQMSISVCVVFKLHKPSQSHPFYFRWLPLHQTNILFIESLVMGRFSEAGLLQWMHFVIFCEKSREVAAHFRADFWVGVASLQWKLNLELWSSTNANTVAVANITVERGWRVGKKVSLCHFLADHKIANS